MGHQNKGTDGVEFLPRMFECFFKYPIPIFTKGKFVLLGAWPGWLLLLLIAVGTVVPAYLTGT